MNSSHSFRLPILCCAGAIYLLSGSLPVVGDGEPVRPGGVPGNLDDRQRWTFQPPQVPSRPAVQRSDWPHNDVDYYVLAALEARSLEPARDADKRTLIRRATFDLIGLPPTPAEIDAFLADDSDSAFARLIDRLLASPHYGERWGRHWLDLVRYADTAGDNSDYPVPQLYKYRNWVIDAFNRDMPYDEFIRHQIAGDLLPSDSHADRQQKIIATGYIANAKRIGSRVDDYPWHLTFEDTIDNLGRTFLGLTINCARCHDHKFDPISTEDYYGLYGFFQSTRYPWPGIELEKVPRDLVPLVPTDQADAAMKLRAESKAQLDAEIKRLEGEKKAADAAAKEVAGALEQAKKDAADDSADVTALEARLADARRRAAECDKQLQAQKKTRDELIKSPLPFDTAYAVSEGEKREPARVHLKGDPEKLGPEVPRRFPTVLGGFALPRDAAGSGRLQLAQWLADPKNPLTARVMVNRIWQFHFGRGIVATPSDFGRQGKPATHPELLDYLARQFIDCGGSIKAMHRLMMMSHTYQLSSQEHAENVATDPQNEFFWRFNRRRLDAESIRDAMLAVSGTLDLSVGGAHPFPPQTTWDFTQHKPFKAVYDTSRRSVYMMNQRIQRHPYLAIFDGPDTNASTAQRVVSTTPLQSLYLMNDPFVHEKARDLAARLIAARDGDRDRIELGHRLCYGRVPSDAEIALAERFLSQIADAIGESGTAAEQVAPSAWESYARTLFRTSEFVYIE